MKRITKILLAVLSGLLIGLAWPVKGWAPLAFIAFVPLLFLQDRIGDRKNIEKGNIFWLSFLTFLIWNSLTTWWVWNSTPMGSIVMLLLNSFFMTFVFWAYHFVKTRLYENKKGYYVLILFVLAFEYLHLNWQLNWPWLNLGNLFSHNHTWIQWYEFTGTAGGTIWVLVSNILAYKMLKSGFNGDNRKQFRNYAISFVLVIFIPLIISKIMYYSYEEKGEDTEIVVVQPNIDPFTEEFTLSKVQIMERNLNLAKSVTRHQTHFVVSPESLIQENIWLENINFYYSIRQLRNFISVYPQAAYIVGGSICSMVPEGQENDFAARKFYDADKYYYEHNTALLIDKSDTVQYYHKSKLTPGVEMMPSWWFLRPIEKFAINLGGTVGTLKKDEKARLLCFDNYKIATLICYESVFGDYVTDFIKEGANLIFVITNDGWWGNTPGHRQHLEFSKLRAIETRRSVARSANTGISAFINQKGDIIEQTKYREETAIRNSIKTNDKITFYVRYGDYLYKMAVFISVFILVNLIFVIVKRKW